ncbi:MAG: hypothetical protein IKG66_01220 [Lachnospiraceae bacterium]|nr:hypothetical protein [Lachnospiraceae bacterium]
MGRPRQSALQIRSEAMPWSRLAPDLSRRQSLPEEETACSIMLQVVVLPFVPVTTMICMPSETAVRMFLETFMATMPGTAVPPRPVLRRAARAALQAATERTVGIRPGFFIDGAFLVISTAQGGRGNTSRCQSAG